MAKDTSAMPSVLYWVPVHCSHPIHTAERSYSVIVAHDELLVRGGALAIFHPFAFQSGDRCHGGKFLCPLIAWQLNEGRQCILATAEFAKQMLHMPGVVHSSPPLAADALQMAEAAHDFHSNVQ